MTDYYHGMYSMFTFTPAHAHKLEQRGKSELPGVNEMEQGHRIVIGHSASWLDIDNQLHARTVHD